MRKITLPTVATTILSLPAGLSADIVVNHYLADNQFAYVAYDMSDFDQQRQDDLPNHGVCYCVPTSSANLLAYVATHGYADVDPGIPFLFDWENQANYGDATALIDDLGDGMAVADGTGVGCGTGPFEAANELAPRVSEHFTVTTDVRDFGGGVEVRMSDIAARNAANQAIGMVCYGRYRGSFDSGGTFNATSRNGGHCVTLNAAIGGGGDSQLLGVRDPWSSLGIDDVQEEFSTNFWTTTDQEVSWFGSDDLGMSRLGDPDMGDTRIRAIDCYVSIAPKCGFTWSPYVPARPLTLQLDLDRWNPDWQPLPPIELEDRLHHIILLPNGIEFLAIGEQGPLRINRLDGKIESLDFRMNEAIADITTDRFGRMWAAAGKQVSMIDRAGRVEVLDLPGNVDAIAQADPLGIQGDNNAVPIMYALMGGEGGIARILRTRNGHVIQLGSFPETNLSPDARLLVAGERAILLDQGQLRYFKGGDGFDESPLEGGPEFPVIDADLDGEVLVVVDLKGRSHAYRIGERLEMASDHPFHGHQTRGRLVLSSSQNALTPWNNPDTFSTEQDLKDDLDSVEVRRDCRSDLNIDGRVDGADMGVLFGAWGQGRSVADINRDGTVNSSDLGLMLGDFGTCD